MNLTTFNYRVKHNDKQLKHIKTILYFARIYYNACVEERQIQYTKCVSHKYPSVFNKSCYIEKYDEPLKIKGKKKGEFFYSVGDTAWKEKSLWQDWKGLCVSLGYEKSKEEKEQEKKNNLEGKKTKKIKKKKPSAKVMENYLELSSFIFDTIIEDKTVVKPTDPKELYETIKLRYKDILSTMPSLMSQKKHSSKEVLEQIHPSYLPMKDYDSAIWQEIARKVDRTFQNFYRGSGYPQLKKVRDYHSFSSSQVGGYYLDFTRSADLLKESRKIERPYVKINNIGNLKLLGYGKRPIEGKVKGYTLTCINDEVSISFPTEIEDSPYKNIPLNYEGVVGLDVGIKTYVTDSEGELFDLPVFIKEMDQKIIKCQKALSRKTAIKYIVDSEGKNRRVRGKNYIKNLKILGKLRQKRVRQMKYFLNNLAKYYAEKYAVVVIEDLKIKNMTKSAKGTTKKPGKNVNAKKGMNREMTKRSFFTFRHILENKLNYYGGRLAVVPPHNTSQNCSGCGFKVPKDLSVRIHDCPECGLILDRDLNASINIKNKYINRGEVEAETSAFKEQ